MASPSGTWITTTEAAQRLGVKRATLYAYVSRGLLRSERRPGQQESLFDRTQIDAMASATRPPGSPQPVLRFRSIATSVSSQVDGDLLYRGRPLQDVVALGSLDDAAAIVLGTSVPQQISRPPQVTGVDLSTLPLERRMPVAIQLVAAADPFASATDPEQVRTTAMPTLGAALRLVSAAAAVSDPVTTDVAALTLAALGGSPEARADVALLRVLLVALLDHGLTASTVAARSRPRPARACTTASRLRMPRWPGRSTVRLPWPPTRCWSTASTRPSWWAGRSGSAVGSPGSATSSTPTATRGPTSSSRPCGGDGARNRCGVASGLSPPSSPTARRAAQHRPGQRRGAARAGPARRVRRGRLPGRPLGGRRRARRRGVRRGAVALARPGPAGLS